MIAALTHPLLTRLGAVLRRRLGRDADSISVGAVIDAVDESIDATKCQGKGNCHNGEQCLTHSLWEGLSDRIAQFLDGITLAELMATKEVAQIGNRQVGDNNQKIELNVL